MTAGTAGHSHYKCSTRAGLRQLTTFRHVPASGPAPSSRRAAGRSSCRGQRGRQSRPRSPTCRGAPGSRSAAASSCSAAPRTAAAHGTRVEAGCVPMLTRRIGLSKRVEAAASRRDRCSHLSLLKAAQRNLRSASQLSRRRDVQLRWKGTRAQPRRLTMSQHASTRAALAPQSGLAEGYVP